MPLEQWTLDRLRPYGRNPRTHSPEQVEQIARSIQAFGFTNPILVDRGGTIIAGHGRLLAAQRLGLAEVPVIVLGHMNDAQRRALVIADNQLALNAGWDETVLAEELRALQAEDFDLSLVGFSDDELAELLADGTESADGAEPSTPDVPTAPTTVVGDVWILGNHRVVCGDATCSDSWDRLGIPRSESMTFTSPPYGVGDCAKLRDHYVRGAETRESLYTEHADNPDDWPRLMRDWSALALGYTASVVCNVQMLANNKRDLLRWAAELADHVVDIAVWDKKHGAPQMQANVLNNAFEWIVMLSPEDGASRAIPFGSFHGSEENIIRIDPRSESNEFSNVHRAVMPIALAEWAIRVVGATASTIVDPFGGTGTTIIAADRLRRSGRAIEMDPRYVDVIVQRWQELTGGTAKLEADGRAFAEVAASRAG